MSTLHFICYLHVCNVPSAIYILLSIMCCYLREKLSSSDLVGREVVAEKRSAEDEPNFAPLTPTAKVKPIHGKRSQESENVDI